MAPPSQPAAIAELRRCLEWMTAHGGSTAGVLPLGSRPWMAICPAGGCASGISTRSWKLARPVSTLPSPASSPLEFSRGCRVRFSGACRPLRPRPRPRRLASRPRHLLRDLERPRRPAGYGRRAAAPIEWRFASAIDATREAWRLLTVGATGVYIFDDTTGKAYWPDHFAELYARAS
jgi:hypothetical protein